MNGKIAKLMMVMMVMVMEVMVIEVMCDVVCSLSIASPAH
jgi:hypothetical protein